MRGAHLDADPEFFWYRWRGTGSASWQWFENCCILEYYVAFIKKKIK